MPKRNLLISVSACVLALAYSPAAAAGGERGAGDTLEDALGALFAESPVFAGYGARTREAAAQSMQASGAFDLVAGTVVQAQRGFWSAPYGALTTTAYDDASVQAELSTRTRENITLDLIAAVPLVTSVNPTASPDQPLATTRLSVPLLKLGRGASFGAEERAAGLHARAIAALQEELESELTMQVASGYWRWVASSEQVAVTRRLEEIAKSQLKDVDQLIAQHARAETERLPFVAGAESAAATREQAEATMRDQEETLWTALGVRPPSVPTAPRGRLPDVPTAPARAEEIAAEARRAIAERPLFAYLDGERSAAKVRFDAARIGQRPDLTLSAQGTMTRVGIYGDPSSATPTQTELGYYGGVSLTYSMPLQNRTARGALDAARAVRVERDLDAASRRSAALSRIEALATDLAAVTSTYQRRVRAAEAYEDAYAAERTRYRLGSATAIDVVVAAQQLARAAIAVLADRTSYALALTELLHESGLLTGPVRTRDPAAVVRRLTSSPF